MAEVGLAASLIAVAEISVKIAGLCKYYIQHAKDARKDLRKVLLEIKGDFLIGFATP